MRKERTRRDEIRDEISALPEHEQDAARQAEADRQQQWDELRRAHQLKWKVLPATPSLNTLGRTSPSGGISGDTNHSTPNQHRKWRDGMKVGIPLRYLNRGRGSAT